MNISSLREFIVPVLTCDEIETLAGIWRLFQQADTDQIVVVNQRQAPLGLLKLCRLVPLFSEDQAQLLADQNPSSIQNQTLKQALVAHPGLLESVVTIRADAALAQVQARLAEMSQQSVVVVNAAGEYAGLLDRMQLFHFFCTQATTTSSSTPSSTQSARQAFPEPLIDLLERLPLPLMLQTSAGRVITQNLAWRQRVGAIQNPQRIRRAAARILEAALVCRTDAKPRSPIEARSKAKSAAYSAASNRTRTNTTASRSSKQKGICQLGTEPNTCVCVCPMKTGQDRVWQFVKVPMGVSATPTPEALSISIAAWDTNSSFGQATALPFKLASLKFSPDPNWRSLMQTETLWLVLAQDMTEQQQVAKELAARNADLIQLNRLKDEFLACISHELKTPLTAVLGMSSLLKDQLLGDLNERQSHYAHLIYRSGRHLVAIINNILDLTRIETGQLELLPEPIHIPSLCQQAYEQAQQQQLVEGNSSSATSGCSDLHFQLEVQPELQRIVADELRLRQMLINLLSNAIKFTEAGGEIGLQVEAWEGWIAFTVWDTGIGIPEEKQHLIFQKFQQLEHPLTRQFHGTGLGLVLTQRLARLHGGDISFTSVSGQGSQFTLLLPPVPPQASALDFDLPVPKTQQLTPTADRNRLVLIVEADADRLEERVDQLTELGYRAVIARSGTEAIEKARRLQPRVILLNPLLPLLSGWDVLTLLKADETTRRIPIVVTAVRVERDQAYQNGADSFLNLPIESAVLQHCLQQLIHPVEPELPEPIADLTVLHLYEGSPSFTLVSTQHHCRVLEVDDLEQADLLARVWKPDVVLIDQIQTEPQAFVQQLSQAASLVSLPLITLSAELTQAANQIPGLSVFPYLAMIQAAQDGTLLQPNMSELMQIMQLAAGLSWVPQILVVDCAAINLQASPSQSTRIRPPVRALVQYLQTAGFRSAVSSTWDKVQQKLQHQSIDLLLLCVSETEPSLVISEIAEMLEQNPSRPPILVWNYQSQVAETNIPPANLEEAMLSETGTVQWDGIATRILPASMPILDLLAQINQTLADRRRRTMGER